MQNHANLVHTWGSRFYPKEKVASDLDVEEVIHMLYRCDERSLKIVKAVLRATLLQTCVNTHRKRVI